MAVVEPNVLACMGLENTLRKIIPIAEVCTFASYEALMETNAEDFAHFLWRRASILNTRISSAAGRLPRSY